MIIKKLKKIFKKKNKEQIYYCCDKLKEYLKGDTTPEGWSQCPYCSTSTKEYILPDVSNNDIFNAEELIESVEQAVRDSILCTGMVKTWPENRRMVGPWSDIMSFILVDICEDLAKKFKYDGKGDPNLTFMHMMAITSYAWINFIFYAKGLAVDRYGANNTNYIMKIVQSFPEEFRIIRERSIEYAKKYPLDNPKWDECMKKLVENTYKKRCKTGEEMIQEIEKGCCDNPFYKEHCFIPFLGVICTECEMSWGVHHTWAKNITDKISTIRDFQILIDTKFNKPKESIE